MALFFPLCSNFIFLAMIFFLRTINKTVWLCLHVSVYARCVFNLLTNKTTPRQIQNQYVVFSVFIQIRMVINQKMQGKIKEDPCFLFFLMCPYLSVSSSFVRSLLHLYRHANYDKSCDEKNKKKLWIQQIKWKECMSSFSKWRYTFDNYHDYCW